MLLASGVECTNINLLFNLKYEYLVVYNIAGYRCLKAVAAMMGEYTVHSMLDTMGGHWTQTRAETMVAWIEHGYHLSWRVTAAASLSQATTLL